MMLTRAVGREADSGQGPGCSSIAHNSSGSGRGNHQVGEAECPVKEVGCCGEMCEFTQDSCCVCLGSSALIGTWSEVTGTTASDLGGQWQSHRLSQPQPFSAVTEAGLGLGAPFQIIIC